MCGETDGLASNGVWGRRAIWMIALSITVPAPHVWGAATPPPPGSYTIVALPDTQFYSLYPEYYPHFTNQTNWIKNNKTTFNIKFVLHEGDIIHTGTEAEWQRARDAMKTLTDNGIPYALVPGNHEYGPGGHAELATGRDDTLFNNYFGPSSDYANQQTTSHTLKDIYESQKYENSCHTFSVPDRNWLVFALEFGPRVDVVTWAHNKIAAFPNHFAILVTHAYLYSCATLCTGDGVRYGDYMYKPSQYTGLRDNGGVTDGNYMWNNLVAPYEYFALVCCGHVIPDGAARLASTGTHNNVVHQMLADYQTGVRYEADGSTALEGGQGYMRLLMVQPDGKTVQVRAYSPSLDEYKTHSDHQFTITLPPARAEMTNPPQGSQLTSSTVQFTWQPGIAADQYYLEVGRCVGDSTYFAGSTGTNLTQLVTGVPMNGQPVYVRLKSHINDWAYLDYVYLTVVSPTSGTIQLSTSSFARSLTQGRTATDTFTVRNSGAVGSQLNYTISDDASWLTVVPTSGNLGGGQTSGNITIYYTTSSLSLGVHTSTITVDDIYATNSPQTIAVSLHVLGSGDFDTDGDVDQEDFGVMQGCFSGNAYSYPLGCREADLDSDGDVDMTDFAQFQNCFAGPYQPPKC